MEGKKVLVMEMVALTLLMSVLVASARHPLLRFPLLGKRPVGRGDLACCDSCDCGDNGADGCSCSDSVPGACTDGCDDCDCNDEESCQCLDVLYSCPDSCTSDYVPDVHKAPAEKWKGEASHAGTSD